MCTAIAKNCLQNMTAETLRQELKKKKKTSFWFPCCSTRENFSIDASITNVGLILTKLGFLSLGTDRQTQFWNPHMETYRHTKNFNSKLKISG